MSVQAHLEALAEKRQQIKDQINAEMARPAADFRLINDLKKQNLVLKEEMQHYLIALRKSGSATS